jgi:hypothetical protein
MIGGVQTRRSPVLIAAAAGIVLATLTPAPGTGQLPSACIVCGERAIADALVNVLLFTPLGIGLGLIGMGLGRSLLLGALLSGLVEATQLVIPGRDPSIGDVLFNSGGVVLGMTLTKTARLWLYPTGRRAARLSLVGAAFACAAFGLTGLLLSPSFPRTVYWGQWTANLGHLEWYRGRVLRANVGPVPAPSHRLRNSKEVRRLLMNGSPIAVDALAGPRIPALGPLFSIFDQNHREIILVGPDRDDLVFRYRTTAVALRLDQPSVRLHAAMRGISTGDTITVRIENEAGVYCMALNAVRRCGLGSGIGRGWAMLLYSERFPARLVLLLDFAWLGALMLPVGLWARVRWETAAGLLLVLASGVMVPWLTVLVSSGRLELLGTGAGFFAGVLLGVRVRRSHQRPPALS